MSQKLISIIIPVFNEEENIFRCYNHIKDLAHSKRQEFDFEFVFTDNCSQDRTFELLEEIALKDSRVKVLRFSKNFGYQKSIKTGYSHCSGDAAIQLDCDLQDPPEMISTFLEYWRLGYAVVYGVRKSRKESTLITLTRKLFYRIINLLSDTYLPLDAGDFRLIDRRIINLLKQENDATPYIRGRIAQYGFKQKGIVYDRREREHGETHFSFVSLISLAMDGVINHSTIPLRIATFCGLSTFLIASILIGYYSISYLFLGQQWPSGFATTLMLLLFSISINSILFGIIGEYIARIYKQVKGQ